MPHHILVVEDERTIADTLIYALESEGFSVAWRTTAREAVESFSTREPDLIVLDVGLPDTNGFELCKQIRRTSSVPIIFLTARTSEVDRVVGLEIGGDDYVPKPFSPREVAARVRAVLRRAQPADSTQPFPQQAGESPFVIDSKRMKIAFFGQPLELTRYEFRILEALLAHPGWVYSRDKLMDIAWDEPAASTDRTVDAHIKTIRAKLNQIRPGVESIITHRGVGYSMRDTW